MKRVTYTCSDYEPTSCVEWVENYPALLVNEKTILCRIDDYLIIGVSENAVIVDGDNSVNWRQFKSKEIWLNEDGKKVTIEEFAKMSVVDLGRFLKQ